MQERARAIGQGAGLERETPTPGPAGTPAVPLSVYRTDERLTVAALMPGLEPDDITVEIGADNTLRLVGERRGGLKGVKEELLQEWTPGPYRRVFALPNAVDATLTNVTFRNGVLVVAMPIASRTVPGRLRMEEVGVAHGVRDASAGHPVRPTERT